MGQTALARRVLEDQQVSRQIICRADSHIGWSKTPLPHATWPLGENEVSDTKDTVVMPLLTVGPILGASSQAAFEVPAGSERSAYGLDVLVSELRTTRVEEGASGLDGEVNTTGPRTARRPHEGGQRLGSGVWDSCENPGLQPNDWKLLPCCQWPDAGPGGSEDTSSIQTFLVSLTPTGPDFLGGLFNNGPNGRERWNQPRDSLCEYACQPLHSKVRYGTSNITEQRMKARRQAKPTCGTGSLSLHTTTS